MSVIRIKTKNLRRREQTGKVFFTVDDLEDFPDWPDSDLVELLHGDLFMLPSPTPLHQRIAKDLEFQIESFLRKNNLGELFHAPIDVELGPEDLVIPDILIVANEEKEIIGEKRIKGTPSVIFEIVSSNKKRDFIDKKEIYEQYKVKEYIIIEPEEKYILIYRLHEDQKYYDPLKIEIPGKFVLQSFPNLELTLKKV